MKTGHVFTPHAHTKRTHMDVAAVLGLSDDDGFENEWTRIRGGGSTKKELTQQPLQLVELTLDL